MKVKTHVSEEKAHVGKLIELSEFTKDNVYLEIGTRFGQSLYMATQASPDMQIISIDKHQVKDVVNAYKDRVKFMEFTSDAGCRRLKAHGVKISGAFVDGDHSTHWARHDMKACLELFDGNGFIAGHDFTKRKGYGVMQAAMEVFGIESPVRINRRWRVLDGEFHVMHTVWVYIPDSSMPKYKDYLDTL